MYKRIIVREKYSTWIGPVRGGVFSLKYLWEELNLSPPLNYHLFNKGWYCAFTPTGWNRVGIKSLEVCQQAKADGLIFNVKVIEVSGEIIFEDDDQVVFIGNTDNTPQACLVEEKFSVHQEGKTFAELGLKQNVQEYFELKIEMAIAMGDTVPIEWYSLI